jgi:23S rRNA (guanine745-N1)-methyltransferase
MATFEFWKAYTCPHCSQRFDLVRNSLVCPNNHCFDISKDGYVNLVPVNKKHSLHPGDNKEMVLARNELLHTGLYDFLIQWIVDYLIAKNLKVGTFLEVGCGTAYYLDGIARGVGSEANYGTDVSKEAIKFCAKAQRGNFFSINNSFGLNLQDNFFDLVLSVFSPFAHAEIERVLSKEGVFILVRPEKDHLKELYEIIGLQSKDKNDVTFDNLVLMDEEILSVTLHPDAHLISLLIQMTPLFWSIDQKRIDIHSIHCKELTAKLKVSCYTKR